MSCVPPFENQSFKTKFPRLSCGQHVFIESRYEQTLRTKREMAKETVWQAVYGRKTMKACVPF